MPFKSEKQRRYLWANEPEIARDWTDTYGSGIHKALGGRIGFYRGSDRHAGTGGRRSSGMDMSGATHKGGTTGSGLGGGHHGGGEWSGPTYSAPPTVTVSGPNVHGEGIGSQTFNQNLRTLQKQQQYQQGAYQRAHPFLSKIQSGLGSLGRGIGNIARNFNPISFAFDNPLMKLLTSQYGQGSMRNLFQRNNQNINWNDPDEEEDIAWENINYNPNTLTRLEQLGIMGPNILPEDKPYESYFDDRNLMAGPIGNYAQQAVANQLLGQPYGTLDPFQQQQVNDAINTYGTTSLGTLRG
jgi:hypothetical protein|tara:strand:+ start:156 stop:1046 length:891 start_codon:yes stop_codon:yes gene_type:complete